VRLDLKIDAEDIQGIIAQAREAEQLGADGLWSSELRHDPFLPLAIAAEHTSRARSPSPRRRASAARVLGDLCLEPNLARCLNLAFKTVLSVY
jgi:Luciferase-like monooxygenase